MLSIFDNAIIRPILHVRRIDCVITVDQRRHHRLNSMLTQLNQRMLQWFGHAAKRSEGDIIRDLLLPTLPRS